MSDKLHQINNIEDLTNDLIKNYEKLTKGLLAEKRAKEISNMAGKTINSAKLQLEYNSFMKYDKRKIAFLEVSEENKKK